MKHDSLDLGVVEGRKSIQAIALVFRKSGFMFKHTCIGTLRMLFQCILCYTKSLHHVNQTYWTNLLSFLFINREFDIRTAKFLMLIILIPTITHAYYLKFYKYNFLIIKLSLTVSLIIHTYTQILIKLTKDLKERSCNFSQFHIARHEIFIQQISLYMFHPKRSNSYR